MENEIKFEVVKTYCYNTDSWDSAGIRFVKIARITPDRKTCRTGYYASSEYGRGIFLREPTPADFEKYEKYVIASKLFKTFQYSANLSKLSLNKLKAIKDIVEMKNELRVWVLEGGEYNGQE